MSDARISTRKRNAQTEKEAIRSTSELVAFKQKASQRRPTTHRIDLKPSSPPSVQLHRGHPGGHHHGGGHAKGIDVPLLAGEKIEAVYADITFLCAYSLPTTVKGTMTVTNYKLYFRSGSQDSNPLILDVPLGFVSRVEKVGGQRSSGDSAYGLEIYCKDIRSLRFRLNKSDSQHSRKDIFEMVREFQRAKERYQIQSY